MIILDKELFISRGSVRACYHHPQKNNLIIKVPTGSKKDRDQANVNELKGYHALMLEHTDLSCISHCYGFDSTNLGRGLVCDCIYDSDGSVSKTILDLIISESPPDFSYLIDVVEKFCEFILNNSIYVFDLNVKNIVLQQQKNGIYKPYLIDLKGRCENKEFIPLSRHIPYFRRKKLERRCRQLFERTTSCWERRDELAKDYSN